MKKEEKIDPFHLAFAVHSLQEARRFYGQVLGLIEGRSSSRWVDYSLFGHQIVCHLVDENHRSPHYFNPVDSDDIPVPHFGVCLNLADFHQLAERLKRFNVKFVVEPHLRFQGEAGEVSFLVLFGGECV